MDMDMGRRWVGYWGLGRERGQTKGRGGSLGVTASSSSSLLPTLCSLLSVPPSHLPVIVCGDIDTTTNERRTGRGHASGQTPD